MEKPFAAETQKVIRALYEQILEQQRSNLPVKIDDETLRIWMEELGQTQHDEQCVHAVCPCCGESIEITLHAVNN